MSHWPNPPLSIRPRSLFLCNSPQPARFLSLYPGMRSEFQIRIRVSIGISCIIYLLKHLSASLFLLSGFARPPKDVLSCVLFSPGDEWHIRDSLQLILSFILCERKLRACSPFTLYLLSFEIMLNVMLSFRWGALCLFKFHSVCDAPLRNRGNLNIKAKQEFFQFNCWLLLELLQENSWWCVGCVPFKAHIVFGWRILSVIIIQNWNQTNHNI